MNNSAAGQPPRPRYSLTHHSRLTFLEETKKVQEPSDPAWRAGEESNEFRQELFFAANDSVELK